jgi:hypothetical protein
LIKHCTPVLRWKHHVVQQHRDIMALMNVLAHASTLRPKGRGINPVVIKKRGEENSPHPFAWSSRSNLY